MAKVTAPLLSFGAAGQIAKTQVYSRWRGIGYSRRYVIPANPQSSGQTLTRNTFKYLNEVWKLAASDAQLPWTAFAQGKPLINRNAYIQKNLPLLRSETDNTKLVGSPGANGGVAIATPTFTGGTGKITVAFTAPTLPTGWTLVSGVAMAILNEDPQTTTIFNSFTNSVTASPWSLDITVEAGDYVVTAWMTMTKSDGSTAYSPSETGEATAT